MLSNWNITSGALKIACYIKLSLSYAKRFLLSRNHACVSMRYMEIALLSTSSLRIKDKVVSFVVDPTDKTFYNAALLVEENILDVQTPEETVIINGPGEYEVGGVKMVGYRAENNALYSLSIAGVDVLLGNIKAMEKMQNKVKEHNIVIALCNEVSNASFLTALTTNVLMFYGEKAAEVSQSLSKENINTTSKYTTTKDKLPQEVETVVLS